MGRSLLYLPCRHHIFELILGLAFETKVSVSSGPNVALFERFQKEWGKNWSLFLRKLLDENLIRKNRSLKVRIRHSRRGSKRAFEQCSKSDNWKKRRETLEPIILNCWNSLFCSLVANSRKSPVKSFFIHLVPLIMHDGWQRPCIH